MKPLLKVINSQENTPFHIMRVSEPYFFPSWHFHPEFEIMFVLEGTGMRFVGDSMKRFQPGDLVFYGDKIPHLYRSDKEYYDKDSKMLSKALVIYLKDDFLGGFFWNLQNMALLRKLFSRVKRGVKFVGKARDEIGTLILKLNDQKDELQKVIDLLSILQVMSTTSEYELLSSAGFSSPIVENHYDRINRVYQYVMDNYASNPTLEQVSEIACMSPTAFCRFFKSHTNKTYIQFLNEIKLGYACKMLIDDDLSVSQVCYASGFNNKVHFHNQFKKNTGLTPVKYRREHV